jgi:hypothetical protein
MRKKLFKGSLVARQPHNLKVLVSNPSPANIKKRVPDWSLKIKPKRITQITTMNF